LGLLLFGLVAFQLSQSGKAGGEGSMIIKLINKDKKQFAVFVPQHFSKQFFACYLGVKCIMEV
jgi:hypothetical protein